MLKDIRNEQRVYVFTRWATLWYSCGLLNKTIGLFSNSSAYLWLSQNKNFFPSVRFFQHQASSSFRNKTGPQQDNTSSLVNKQFEKNDTLRLLWIWIRDPSQSLADTARGNLFGCFFCQRIIKREKRKKSCIMYAGCEIFFITISTCFANLLRCTNKLKVFSQIALFTVNFSHLLHNVI